MGLVEDFPTDPFVPSLRYAASCQLPITVPWSQEPIRLGTSLTVPRDPGTKAEFSSKSAFSETALQQSKLVFTSSSQGGTSEATTSNSASSAEHCNFSIAAQIGGSFLGASGQANYEKHVTNDDSDVKSSFRASYRCGKITFLELPKLSEHAVELLRWSKNPDQAFRDEYGVFYVAAYILGGSNANMMGGVAASSSFSKDLAGQYTVKVCFIKSTKHFGEHERSGSAKGQATLSAFDSLDRWESNVAGSVGESYADIMRISSENSLRGWNLAKRVEARGRELGLYPGMEIPWGECEGICRGGIVMEILLMPYAGLKEYVAAVTTGQ